MKLLRRRPWLLVVAAVTLFVVFDLVLLVIAVSNPPTPLR